MAEFYTNLPPKDKDELEKTIEKLTTTDYETEYQFKWHSSSSVVSRGHQRNQQHT